MITVLFLKDLWASIPPQTYDYDYDLVQKGLPDDLVYRTITGWKVKRWSGFIRPRTLPPRTWWRKAYWNAYSLFIVLPLRTTSFMLYDLPYYGCYLIWVEAMVFPYYRQGYHDWWTNSQEISVVPDDKHVVTFMMRGQTYQFQECNCSLPKNEPGRIRVRFHSKSSVKAGDDENFDMMEEQVQIIVANDDIFWHNVRQAQFSCFKTVVKILLGVLWLQCVFVPTTNLFFLLGALVLEVCKRASTYGLFWFQISPLHLVDDFTIFWLFAWTSTHVCFIFLSLGTLLAKFPVLKDRQDPPGFHYIASPTPTSTQSARH